MRGTGALLAYFSGKPKEKEWYGAGSAPASIVRIIWTPKKTTGTAAETWMRHAGYWMARGALLRVATAAAPCRSWR